MLQIAGNIKLIRSLAGKTQPEFAIIIGENLSNLKTYETKGVMPKPHIQHRIAKIGGVSLHDLINRNLTPDDIQINLEVDKVKKVNNNTPVRPQEAQHAPDPKDEIISLLKELNELRRKPAGKEISLAELSRELQVTAQMLSAAIEILVVIAGADPKKAVYSKTVEILRKHKLEGSFL